MGYRSDVELVFYSIEPERLSQAAIKLWFDENYPVADAKSEWGAEVTYGSSYVRIRYEYVKWYESYSHPNAVLQARIAFGDLFKEYGAYEFARVGEEMRDIELGAFIKVKELWDHRDGVFKS